MSAGVKSRPTAKKPPSPPSGKSKKIDNDWAMELAIRLEESPDRPTTSLLRGPKKSDEKHAPKPSCPPVINYLLLLSGTTMYGLYGIFAKLSKGEEAAVAYSISSCIFISELAKFIISIGFLMRDMGLSKAFGELKQVQWRHRVLFAVPALIYCLTNNLDIYTLRFMDPGSQQILSNLKILTTGLLWRVVFKKQLAWRQWGALVLLLAGNVMVQWPSPEPMSGKTFFVKPFGTALMLVTCFGSAFAGIYSEWVFKRGPGHDLPIHLQNIWLYLWGILVNGCLYFAQRKEGAGLLTGFNGWTWMYIANMAVHGLVLSAVMKYFSNIIKLFMNGAAIFISVALTWYIFDLEPTILFRLGLFPVSFALMMYNYSDELPHKARLFILATSIFIFGGVVEIFAEMYWLMEVT